MTAETVKKLASTMYGKCLNDNASAGWTRALIETLFLSVRLQAIAIAEENDGKSCEGLQMIWDEVAKILSDIVENSSSQTLRRKAITALLELSKDFSMLALSPSSTEILETGCKTFVTQLCETRSHITDVPHVFSNTLPELKSTMDSWIACLEYDTTPIECNHALPIEIESLAMRERGALYVFFLLLSASLSPAMRTYEISGRK